MKWGMLVVVLIVGGSLYYMLFCQKPEEGTADATAQRFVEAAMAGDTAAVHSLCLDASVHRSADRAAASIKANPPDVSFGIQLKTMTTDPPRKGRMMTLSGRILAIELLERDGEWKIAAITLSGQ